MKPVRVLFLPQVDEENTNAQSLNTREVALRLDRQRFHCTFFYSRQPDKRLLDVANFRLVKLPARRTTWPILGEMLGAHDIVAYLDYSPASYLFLHVPKFLRKAIGVFHAEAPQAQIINPSRQLEILVNSAMSRCDVYTAITPYVARDLEKRVQRPVRYILPVGVDCQLFSPPPRRFNPEPTVLFAGTLIERKGPQHVLTAAARFPHARFRLVGTGRDGYDQQLRDKIKEMGLSNVALDGPKRQAELVEIMQQSDIFLLPSRLEGLPKVTLEAAATGLPCIVFRDYETPSVVDGATGFQVQSLDEMMDRLGQLLADSALCRTMGAAARELALEFQWDKVSRMWEEAYLDIAGRS